jgi:hypothetical protein
VAREPGPQLEHSRPHLATGIGVAPGFVTGGRGITATQMFGRAAADTGDGALDLYYPNERCKTVKLRKLSLKARIGEKKPNRKQRRKLRRLRRKIGRSCQPAAVEPPLL